MKKRLVCLLLASVMAVSVPVTAMADEESDLQTQIDANNAALNSTQNSISDTQNAQDTVKQEISDLDSQLVSVMSDISLLEAQIDAYNSQIEQTSDSLVTATTTRDEQYASMKTRIAYIYETDSGSSWLSYILKADSFADLLNRVAYTQEMTAYDREQLENYKQTVAEITALEAQLEEELAQTTSAKENLETQQASLNTLLEEKKAQSDNYEAEIASLQEQANTLSEELIAQNEQLKAIQEEKKRREEEARKAAEEAARKAAEEAAAAQKAAEAQAAADAKAAAEAQAAAQKAAEEAAAQAAAQKAAEEAAKNNSSSSSSSGSSSNSGSSSSDSSSSGSSSGGGASGSWDTSASRTGDPNVANQQAAVAKANGLTNSMIASLALSKVGCGYVVAQEGPSVFDCAGLVAWTLRQYGINVSRSLPLFSQMGVAVSPSDLQPGDLILYYNGGSIGHVNIYIGNGQAVGASSPGVGVIVYNNIYYKPIATCRRIIY